MVNKIKMALNKLDVYSQELLNFLSTGLRFLGQGFIIGVKETPRGFFAPAVAVWLLLVGVSDSLTNQKNDRKHA